MDTTAGLIMDTADIIAALTIAGATIMVDTGPITAGMAAAIMAAGITAGVTVADTTGGVIMAADTAAGSGVLSSYAPGCKALGKNNCWPSIL
jgi:hypothetical protein